MRNVAAIKKSARGVAGQTVRQTLKSMNQKYHAGADPLDREMLLNTIQPNSQQELDAMTNMLQKLVDESGGDPQKRQALDLWKFQIAAGGAKDQVRLQFLRRFYFWLLGRGDEEDHAKTMWGRGNAAAHNATVAAYIDQFVDKRAEYALKLNALSSRVPDSLNGYYLYFKYIVNGGLKRKKLADGSFFWDMSNEDYLEDFDIFQQVFDKKDVFGNKEGEGRYADLITPMAEYRGDTRPYEGHVPFPVTSANLNTSGTRPGKSNAVQALNVAAATSNAVAGLRESLNFTSDNSRRPRRGYDSFDSGTWQGTPAVEDDKGTRSPRMNEESDLAGGGGNAPPNAVASYSGVADGSLDMTPPLVPAAGSVSADREQKQNQNDDKGKDEMYSPVSATFDQQLERLEIDTARKKLDREKEFLELEEKENSSSADSMRTTNDRKMEEGEKVVNQVVDGLKKGLEELRRDAPLSHDFVRNFFEQNTQEIENKFPVNEHGKVEASRLQIREMAARLIATTRDPEIRKFANALYERTSPTWFPETKSPAKIEAVIKTRDDDLKTRRAKLEVQYAELRQRIDKLKREGPRVQKVLKEAELLGLPEKNQRKLLQAEFAGTKNKHLQKMAEILAELNTSLETSPDSSLAEVSALSPIRPLVADAPTLDATPQAQQSEVERLRARNAELEAQLRKKYEVTEAAPLELMGLMDEEEEELAEVDEEEAQAAYDSWFQTAHAEYQKAYAAETVASKKGALTKAFKKAQEQKLGELGLGASDSQDMSMVTSTDGSEVFSHEASFVSNDESAYGGEDKRVRRRDLQKTSEKDYVITDAAKEHFTVSKKREDAMYAEIALKKQLPMAKDGDAIVKTFKDLREYDRARTFLKTEADSEVVPKIQKIIADEEKHEITLHMDNLRKEGFIDLTEYAYQHRDPKNRPTEKWKEAFAAALHESFGKLHYWYNDLVTLNNIMVRTTDDNKVEVKFIDGGAQGGPMLPVAAVADFFNGYGVLFRPKKLQVADSKQKRKSKPPKLMNL